MVAASDAGAMGLRDRGGLLDGDPNLAFLLGFHAIPPPNAADRAGRGPAIIGVPVIVVRKACLDAVAITNRRMPEREQS